MKNDEELFFKIEDYLDGKLSQAEATAFELEIAADRELAETVEMHRFERDGLDYMAEENLRKKIIGWETYPPQVMVEEKPSNRKWVWWGGLGLVVLLTAGVFFFWDTDVPQNVPSNDSPATSPQNNNETPEEVPDVPSTKSDTPIATHGDDKQSANPPSQNGYDEKLFAYADSKIGTPSALDDHIGRNTTGSETELLKEWKDILRQSKPNYGKAINGLLKIKQGEGFEDAQSLLAFAYFKDKQFGKAAAIFEQLSKSDKLTPSQKDEAEWQLLMSLLPDKSNHKKVDELLSKMTNPNYYHEYLPKAIELKAELRKG